MLCESLMKTSVECVTPDESVVSAARLMRDGNLGFLPVCEEYSGRVVGAVTRPGYHSAARRRTAAAMDACRGHHDP